MNVIGGIFKIVKLLGRAVSIHFLLQQIVFKNLTVRYVIIVDTLLGARFHTGEDEIADIRMRAGGRITGELT